MDGIVFRWGLALFLSFAVWIPPLYAANVPMPEVKTGVPADSDSENPLIWSDIRDFGAYGNDSTDDEAVQINAALEQAAKKGQDTVYIPAGVWDVATSIRVPSNITLLLHSEAVIRLKPGANLEYGIVTNRNAAPGDFEGDFGIRIIGGTIDGNNANPASGENRGIFLAKCSHCSVENVTVRDTTHQGIRIHSFDGRRMSEHVVVRSCRVIRTQATLENIMLSTQVEEPTNRASKKPFTRYCKVEGCYSSGGSHGISLFNVSDCAVVNNVCVGNSHRGIILSPTCQDCIVTGNVVRNAGSTGIHLAYGSRRCVISGNFVTGTVADGSGVGNEGQGIKAYAGFEDLIITGNQVSSNATDGIALEGGGESRRFIISSNISSDNERDGIRVFAGAITLGKAQDMTDGIVSGNLCTRNRESGIRVGSDHRSSNVMAISITGNGLHRNGMWGIYGSSFRNSSVGITTVPLLCEQFQLVVGLGA